MNDRDSAFKAYTDEVTPNGSNRITNITLCNVGDKTEQHISTQVELAFHAGWHAAIAAVRADYETMPTLADLREGQGDA